MYPMITYSFGWTKLFEPRLWSSRCRRSCWAKESLLWRWSCHKKKRHRQVGESYVYPTWILQGFHVASWGIRRFHVQKSHAKLKKRRFAHPTAGKSFVHYYPQFSSANSFKFPRELFDFVCVKLWWILDTFSGLKVPGFFPSWFWYSIHHWQAWSLNERLIKVSMKKNIWA